MGYSWKSLWQSWIRRESRSNFYRRSLILVLCITSLPTSIIGITFYVTGRSHIEQEVARGHEALLQKNLQRMNESLAQIELAATQWSLDNRLDVRLRKMNLSADYSTTQALYQFLGLMKGAYPLIDRVDLYLDQLQPVIVSDIEGIVPLKDTAQQDRFQAALSQQHSVFWNDSLLKVNPRGAAPGLALIHRVPTIGQPHGALILYLDKAKLLQMVEEMTTDTNGVSILMNQNGQVLVSRPDATPGQQALEAAMREGVQKRGQKNGSFLLKLKEQTYTISYGEFTRPTTPWRYATATSLTQMTAPVVLMSRVMLGVGLFGLLLAFLLSWMASKSLYRPIGRLLNVVKSGKRAATDQLSNEIAYIENQWRHLTAESRELELRLEEAYPQLRSAFLLQLVQGHLHTLGEEELRAKMHDFGWGRDEGWHTLLLLQISGVAKENGRFEESDKQLVAFAASNIAEEMIRTRSCYAQSINFHDLTIGILLSYSPDRSKQQVKEEVYGLADDLVRTISTLLKMQSTICVGSVTSQVSELSRMLPHLRSAIQYRDLAENCQVLDMEETVPGVHSREIGYPFALEKELVQAIRMGQGEQASQLIDSFIRVLATQSGNEKLVTEGGLQVLGSIQHTMLETGVHPHQLFAGQNLFAQLSQLREPEQIVRFLQQRVIRPYTLRLNEHQNQHSKQLVEQVTRHIESRFTQDISLEECADAFGVTPYTLSRAFKQIHGMNYIDYLIRLRINRAKELLDTTHLRINEIAEQVGYQPSYFIRLFKKMEELTPGQYRERKR